MKFNRLKCLVIKFGGSSVSKLTEKEIAIKLKEVLKNKPFEKIICILSAEQYQTDKLKDTIFEISSHPNPREKDALITFGENQSVIKASLYANALGLKAKSLAGWQIPILTTQVNDEKSYITEIEKKNIIQHLADNDILFVAGFQGVDNQKNVTSLGRGGSDITAVAISAALNVKFCQIVTDTDGIKTTDPRLNLNPKLIEKMHYDEAIELAWLGTKIIHPRSVEIAKKFNIPINISFYQDFLNTSTTIDNKVNKNSELSISVSENETLVTIQKFPNKPGSLNKLLAYLFKKNMDVDLLTQTPSMSQSKEDLTEIVFCVNTIDIQKDLHLYINDLKQDILKLFDLVNIEVNSTIIKVSLVNNRIATLPNFTSNLYAILIKHKIPYYLLSGPSNRVSIIIDKDEHLLNKFLKNILTNNLLGD
ncbi:MAG TPA: aspartate kinase [Bacteroidia bacterium]|nr:aspartate kinase [Bacteroidia bacterium]